MISSHILSEIDQMATIIGIINQGSLIFQERMSVLDEQRKPQILLKTSDDETAYRLLVKLNPQRTLDGLQLGALTNEQTGAVVRELCSNNLSVYRVEEHRESLEEIFLTLTGKELTL
jgi:ABC-2 type transport system ATP-binding protein